MFEDSSARLEPAFGQRVREFGLQKPRYIRNT